VEGIPLLELRFARLGKLASSSDSTFATGDALHLSTLPLSHLSPAPYLLPQTMPELQDRLQSVLGEAYQIEREIGGGGMSRLFLASEASLNRQVVIKLLPPEMTSEVSAARFKKEIELAAQLQHPNILPVLTAGADGELIYYVMPYVTGESLRHRLTTDGRASIENTRKVIGEVADALAFAHAQGVVHRDIKPENILLQHGHAVLMDFGVARAVAEAQSGSERLTATGLAIGTPGYMAPEQAAGETHIDARADVYALAVVAYEMLTGSPPFTGASAQAVLAAHMTQDPKPVTEIRTETPKDLSATILKALAKEPSARIQTAAEFRDAVADQGSGTRQAASPITRLPVVGAVIAVAAIALFFLWPRGWTYDGNPRESLIVFPFENRTGDDDNEWLEEASMNLLALSLSHWEDLRVFDDERTASLMRRRDLDDASAIDFDAAQAMAQDANVGTLVMGDIRREGDEIAIEAKVHDVETGARLATEIVRTAVDADPRALLDSLADRILSISGAPPGENPGVLAQTTTSVEAYRSYLRGSHFIQRFETDSARYYFERAVALDTAFALAYIGLRNAEGWQATGGDLEVRRSMVAKAEAHSANLPPRLRSLIQYYASFESGDFPRARRTAQGMIARDSTDTEAWYQLGEAHYHHGAILFPHADTLGDLGEALFAFERTLAIDSSYVLAYFHITDALGNCADPQARLVCLADSTIYGTPDELTQRVGTDEVARLRQDAADRRVEVGYAWAAEVPGAARPRLELTNMLLEQQRYAEAEAQANRLRESGDTTQATDFNAIGTYNLAVQAVQTAGRGFPLDQLLDALPFEEQPFGSSVTGERVLIPIATLADAFRQMREENLAEPAYADRDEARRWEQVAGAFITATLDSAAARIIRIQSCGNTYLFARDTTTFVEWIALLPDSACPVMRGHLALARGDTAAARTLESRVASELPQDPNAWNAENAGVAYAWADLLASMGRPREALDVYARLDSVNFSWQATLLVRSWAERAAIHQTLGDMEDAIRLYQQVLDVLENADEPNQPFVQRVTAALAAARGETGNVER